MPATIDATAGVRATPARLVAQAAASLAAVETLRAMVRQQAEDALSAVLDGSPRLVADWRQLCVAVARGDTVRVHAMRGEREATASEALQAARDAARLSEDIRMAGAPLPRAAELPAVIAELERYVNGVFPRWRTEEDLEDLAGEWYPLSQTQLEEAARRSPAPPEWYAQEGKPF